MKDLTPTTKLQPDGKRSRASAEEAYPLDEYYARHRVAMPLIKRVEAEGVPEPYRGLLVHDRDMTSRLEIFHKRKIHIRVVGRHTQGSEYFREVALELDGTRQPVEFGAIKIHLDLFSTEAREEILRELRPLGRILHTFEIAFTSRPSAYLRVAADAFIGGALGLQGKHVLYGRRNTLLDAWERPLAEIVEILPP
jgi:chorismate-pyruvate lyase